MPAHVDHTRTEAGWGVRVDLDLSRPLDPAWQAELLDLFRTEHLLVFSGQTFTMDDQIRVMGYLGPVLHEQGSGIGYVSNIRKGAALGASELSFHSDIAHCPVPLPAVSLFAEHLDGQVTSTRFVSTPRCYRRLPDGLRARLDDLECENVMPVSMAGRNLDSPVPEWMPRAVHPVVWSHPVTGERGIMVNENQTTRIIGLTDDDSRALLLELFHHLYDDGEIYEHRWRRGDYVIWHNLAVQHARGDLATDGERTLRRVALGELGLWEQCPSLHYADFANHEGASAGRR